MAKGKESNSLIPGAILRPSDTASDPDCTMISVSVSAQLLVNFGLLHTGGQKSSCTSTTMRAAL